MGISKGVSMDPKEAIGFLRLECALSTPCDGCINIGTCRHKEALRELTELVIAYKQKQADLDKVIIELGQANSFCDQAQEELSALRKKK